MKVVCQHCQKILIDEQEEDGLVSHGDCFGILGRPCQKGLSYYMQLAIDMEESYQETISILNRVHFGDS